MVFLGLTLIGDVAIHLVLSSSASVLADGLSGFGIGGSTSLWFRDVGVFLCGWVSMILTHEMIRR